MENNKNKAKENSFRVIIVKDSEYNYLLLDSKPCINGTSDMKGSTLIASCFKEDTDIPHRMMDLKDDWKTMTEGNPEEINWEPLDLR